MPPPSVDAPLPVTAQDVVRACFLAKPSEFAEVFDAARPEGSSVSPFDTILLGTHGDFKAAVARAAELSEQQGFASVLVPQLLMRALTLGYLASTVAADPTAGLASDKTTGFMQAVLDPARGMMQSKVIAHLLAVTTWTGLITDEGNNKAPLGTGFLIKPDLLLTSAHVIEMSRAAMENRRDDIPAEIAVRFTMAQPPLNKVKVPLAPNWRVLSKPPHGKPPSLDVESPLAAKNLDFAVIRLARSVGDVLSYCDLDSVQEPELQRSLFVVGFPGSTDQYFDVSRVTSLNAASARLRHSVNTQSGMSGSPCIGAEGSVCGIHEGTMQENGMAYNRAVHLRVIRDVIRESGVLEADTPFEIADSAERLRWSKAGLSLAGDEANAWRDAVIQLGDPDPGDAAQNTVQREAYHPVFGRESFAAWIAHASGPDAPDRLMLLMGPRKQDGSYDPAPKGSGKTFSAAILRARLNAPAHRLIVLPPEKVALSSPSAAHALVAEALAASPGAAGAGDAGIESLRPFAGEVAKDHATLLLDTLRASGADSTFWIFLDFGRGAAWRDLARTFWTELALQAIERNGFRVIVAGLQPAQADELAAGATSPLRVARDEIDYTKEAGLRTYFRRITQALTPGNATSAADDPFAPFVEVHRQTAAANPIMGTVEAVRVALSARKALKSLVEGP